MCMRPAGSTRNPRERWVKLAKYRVYHKDRPSAYVVIDNDGYFPMEIKSKAIKSSTLFSYSDWSNLRVRGDRK